MPYDPDELLTVEYLSQITHVTKETIRNYIRKYIPDAMQFQFGMRGPYQWRVRRADWQRFLRTKIPTSTSATKDKKSNRAGVTGALRSVDNRG